MKSRPRRSRREVKPVPCSFFSDGLHVHEAKLDRPRPTHQATRVGVENRPRPDGYDATIMHDRRARVAGLGDIRGSLDPSMGIGPNGQQTSIAGPTDLDLWGM
jgi:hypothetical protein